MTIVQRMLPVQLTSDEVAVKADALAREMTDLDVAERFVAEKVKDMKDGLKERATGINVLRDVVRTHKEDRSVDCRREPDLMRKVWMLFREDTGEMVETSSMSSDEYMREAQLDFEKASVRPPPTKADDEDEGGEAAPT